MEYLKIMGHVRPHGPHYYGPGPESRKLVRLWEELRIIGVELEKSPCMDLLKGVHLFGTFIIFDSIV
jgi:hypothetical protein